MEQSKEIEIPNTMTVEQLWKRFKKIEEQFEETEKRIELLEEKSEAIEDCHRIIS